jgi:hypothetical protein
VPRAPLPVTSVTHDRVASSTTSKGITPSSSLVRAHASNQLPPPDFVFPHLFPEVFAGCCEPLLGTASSRRYLCKSLSGCLSLDPVGWKGAFACYFPYLVGLPQVPLVGRLFPKSPRLKRLRAEGVSRSSLFLTFRPPDLLATQVSPTAAPKWPQGSRDFSTRADHASSPMCASGC